MELDFKFSTPTGQTVARELLIAYLNTGTSEAPKWAAVGKRVEDSSMEYDWQTETKKDILGDTYGTMKKPIVTQSFDPCEVDSADTAQFDLWVDGVVNQDAQALANKDMLIAHWYTTDGGEVVASFAERYASCMVEITSLGGEGGGNLGMPINITYGGTRTLGTVTKDDAGAVTFKKAA
jgi:hypothetical protein